MLFVIDDLYRRGDHMDYCELDANIYVYQSDDEFDGALTWYSAELMKNVDVISIIIYFVVHIVMSSWSLEGVIGLYMSMCYYLI